MIAIDSSSFVAYWSGDDGWDVEAVDRALTSRQVVLPPVVLAELLSEPTLSVERGDLMSALPLLTLTDGYWARTGRLRASVLSAGKRTRLADSLIAQACIDHDVALVTRDADFSIYSRRAGLRLVKPSQAIG